MKILLVLEAALGGTGRHIVDLAQGLLDRDHDVHLVYSTLRADTYFTAGLRRLRANCSRFHGHAIPITRELTASDIRAYLQLWRVVRRHGPFDAIHSHSTKAGFLARLLFGKRGAVSVYTPHGLMTMDPQLRGPLHWAVSILEAVLSRLCNAVVAVSHAERICALQTGIRSGDLVVIPNGIDERSRTQGTREEIRQRLGVAPDEFCVGWVGRLTEYKCPGRILESFALLARRSRRPARLILIGWGPLEHSLREQSAKLRIANRVLFLGQVDGREHMLAFDAFAHTSLFEAFGYVFLEALDAGVPIVTTRVGGAEEMVEEFVTGYVCEPWEADRFAMLIEEIVDHPERRILMADAARERAARYSTRGMVDSTEALYYSLLAKHSHSHQDAISASRSPL